MMKSVLVYVQRVWLWLLETDLAYLASSVVLIACVVALAFRSEPAFRYAGLVLQLMGLATVVGGVWDTRRLFGQPTLSERFRRWRGRRPKFRQSAAVGAGLAGVAAAVFSAEAELWAAMPDDAPVGQQLRALKANLLVLSERVNKQRDKLSKAILEGADKLQEEMAARMRRDTELETLIRSAQTGGLDVSFVGLVWLAFGLVLTTSSLEVEKLAKLALGD
jgi:hypothetical protein